MHYFYYYIKGNKVFILNILLFKKKKNLDQKITKKEKGRILKSKTEDNCSLEFVPKKN